MLLLGRHRLTLTRESVTRSLGVFGLVFPLDRVQFKEVTSIECRSDKFARCSSSIVGKAAICSSRVFVSRKSEIGSPTGFVVSGTISKQRGRPSMVKIALRRTYSRVSKRHDHNNLFSAWRAHSFTTWLKERAYLAEKTLPVILEHGRQFIRERLAAAEPKNDGRQTPMRTSDLHRPTCYGHLLPRMSGEVASHSTRTETQRRRDRRRCRGAGPMVGAGGGQGKLTGHR